MSAKGDAELDRIDAALVKVNRRLERIALLLPQLRQDRDAAAATEEATQRDGFYRDGLEAARDYQAVLGEYEKAAKTIAAALAKIGPLMEVVD